MTNREFGFRYDGEPVVSYVRDGAPEAPGEPLDEEMFVFVMGPYTAFDAEYAFEDADQLASKFAEDPLFDPERHRVDGEPSYEAVLDDLCERLREEIGVRAFLATDVPIPTEHRAEPNEEGMSVLDQSVVFAAVSDAVVFVFTEGGLTTGVGSEVGSILGEFHLRRRNDEPVRKPPERFRVFESDGFGSASIDEVPSTYGVDLVRFDSEEKLTDEVRQFLVGLRRNDPDRPLPVFNEYVD
ncbi:hypothetical protein RYH80_09100 [Halobaculum sp. MBLA0147]|uniref:DUF7509 family protein n=1 Tax=Halobaculum sp. MBLA0147 TaxID=3079934 RepID=UPI003523868E